MGILQKLLDALHLDDDSGQNTENLIKGKSISEISEESLPDLSETTNSLTEQKDKNWDEEYLIPSQYSSMPRYYTINGIKYDMDNPWDIIKLPVFKDIITIGKDKYGMDSILRKHGRESYLGNKDVFHACRIKEEEYSQKGYYFETEQEKIEKQKYEAHQKQKELEQAQKIALHDSFTIDDMYQFTEILFEWIWVKELRHTNGIAWFMLNMNNQYIALAAIDHINSILAMSNEYTGFNQMLYVCTENIDFSYPVPTLKDSLPNTFVECVPYTKTGKLSKYPAILHFREFAEKSMIGNTTFDVYRVSGKIYFMIDGSIGKADLVINEYWVKVRLKGLNLVVQRIGKNTPDGNVDIYRQKL